MSSKLKKTLRKISPKFVVDGWNIFILKSRVVRYKIAGILFRSQMKYYCPCCNTKLKSFVAGDFLNRSNRYNPRRFENDSQDVLCPVCGSGPRHRILASCGESHVQLLRSSNVLYFAPEYCMKKWMKKNKIPFTTADLFAKADLKLDIQDTGLSDASYDIIICNHVLEHVDDFRKALREMYRVLRPGGSFICSFPMDPEVELVDEDASVVSEEERLKRFGQSDHKRLFGRKADQFITEAGFQVEKIDGANYPDEILPVVGPADYDMNVLFWGKKKIGPG